MEAAVIQHGKRGTSLAPRCPLGVLRHPIFYVGNLPRERTAVSVGRDQNRVHETDALSYNNTDEDRVDDVLTCI